MDKDTGAGPAFPTKAESEEAMTDTAKLRERLPWITSQMRENGMYTQANEVDAIRALLGEVEALRLLLKECRQILRYSRNHTANVGDCDTCKLIERIDAAIDSAREGK